MLRTVGREHQQFGQRIDLFLNIKQGRSQFFAQRRAARFTRGHHLKSARAQLAREHAELSRFTAAVNSFESNKSARHVLRTSEVGYAGGGS